MLCPIFVILRELQNMQIENKIGLFLFYLFIRKMKNAMQLKGNKLAAVLGTAEIGQNFTVTAKDVTINHF
jgi:hypothetical protein